MKIALYAGSFDPITNGHLEILKAGSKIFDKVIIAVSYNINKKGFLPFETRVKLIKECVKDIDNVEVDCYSGLTTDFAKKVGSKYLLRGLRNTIDFEYEKELSQANQLLSPEIETVFLITKPEYSYISSSGVREIFLNNGNISKLVPNNVKKFLLDNYKTN